MRPIRARAPCVRRCYLAGLARDPSLRGRVNVKLVVDADGWVRVVRVASSELADPSVAACVANELVGLQYPAPEGGARITVIYPFDLVPP